ncbi:hypothetical protein LNKW23_42280 [Paralimibaculum aggregatum]|uniref:Uncharacterized protein n=1 Tax=Paralimibaculum aggregatum TaxID=3036245 RepID=A0ABQ6LSF9_9RHOB|nr:hypothetical protein [Limibaculum sp. NKW23]GMG85012.1 hypothetical protein LNKW23_42280 [Limibaculum sp. NKW23]
MTIGIGAAGQNAGLAVFRALQAAERVGQGAIGGFAVFAAIDAAGRLHRAETQRGGTATLFTEGERTGTPPPPEIAAAPVAAVMSSGPDRPAPLSRFLAADPAAGLVTGHRLPNTPGADGRAVNEAVLAGMAAGLAAGEALAAVLGANPEIDAGMIALDRAGGVAAGNSRLVAGRPDLGTAGLRRGDAAVEVLHNAIRPAASLAPLVAEIAMAVLAPPPAAAGHAVVEAGTPLALGPANRVVVDAGGRALRVEVTAPLLLTGRLACAAVMLGAEVVHDGTLLGTTMEEPNVLVEGGRILRLSGQARFAIPYAAPETP